MHPSQSDWCASGSAGGADNSQILEKNDTISSSSTEPHFENCYDVQPVQVVLERSQNKCGTEESLRALQTTGGEGTNTQTKHEKAHRSFLLSTRYDLDQVVLNIDCESLLQQMVEEASKVVSSIVDITNATWMKSSSNVRMESHRIPEHEEAAFGGLIPKQEQETFLPRAEDSCGIADASALAPVPAPAPAPAYDDAYLPTHRANVIVDDEDVEQDEKVCIPAASGRKPREDSIDDLIMGPPGSNVHVVRQIVSSYLSGGAGCPAITEAQGTSSSPPLVSLQDESAAAVSPALSSLPSPMSRKRSEATVTNLDVVHHDGMDGSLRKKKRCKLDLQSHDQPEEVCCASSHSSSSVSSLTLPPALLHPMDEAYSAQRTSENSIEEFCDSPNGCGYECACNAAVAARGNHKEDEWQQDEVYDEDAIVRACSIVDFVFAGEEMKNFTSKNLFSK